MLLSQNRARHATALAPRKIGSAMLPRRRAFLQVLAGLLLVFTGQAGTDDDPRQLLLHLRQNIMGTIERLPRYVCTLTVDRTRYEPGNPELGTNSLHHRSCDDLIAQAKSSKWKRWLSSSDRLRLDVAVNNGIPGVESEMYSWAGDDRFGNRDLFEFVRDGATSTGGFASMLASIFGNGAATFSYNGDNTVGGRGLSEFGFRIPLEKSQYMYVVGRGLGRQEAMAYSGTILADSETADLVRLALRTSQPPADTGACEISQTLDYGRVKLNGADFLLPAKVLVSVIHTDGTEADNQIQFSACHEYHSDVKVTYDSSGEAQLSGPPEKTPAGSLGLPPGLPFKVVFLDRIDTATAAAGDLIRGRLKTAIRDESGEILVAEGTPVTGRILRLKRLYNQSPRRTGKGQNIAEPPSLILDVKLEAIEIAGVFHPLKAAFDSGLRRQMKQSGPLTSRVDIGSLDDTQDRDDDNQIGTFEFHDSSAKPVVKPGLESSWATAP
jgi:hypothetical protein